MKQRDLTDCGVTCLASIAAYYRYFIPVSKLRQYSATDKHGTNISGIIRAAGKLDLFARGIKAQVKNLQELPLPMIAHVIKNDLQHFVVIYRLTKSRLTLMDPADGRFHHISLEAFQKIWTGILVLVQPNTSFQKRDLRVPTYLRYLELIKPHRFLLLQVVIASVIYTILGLLPSIYIQKIVDHVLPAENFRLLNLLSMIMVGSVILQVLLGYVKSLFILQTGMQMDARLILGYYRHLLGLPQKFFDSMQVGEMMSRLNDAVKIRTFLNNVAIEMVINFFIIVFSSLLMFIYNMKLALLVMAVIPFYAALYFLNNWLNRKWQRLVMEHAAQLESQFVESLSSIRTIKKYASEDYFNLKVESSFMRFLKSIFKSSYYNVHTMSLSDLFLKSITVAMLWMGSYYVLRKDLTTGELLSFYSLLGYFTMPATALITSNRSYQEAMIAGNRLFEIFDLEPEAAPHLLLLNGESAGDIHLNDIHFSYGSRGKVFNGLSLVIEKGKSVAITGESGSGKSTLFALLQKVYAPDQGTITLGGHDLKYVSNGSIRKVIAIVPQDIQLFSGTVIENIAIGVYEPDMSKVIQLCRLLGIDEFIGRLPGSYYTLLNEGGTNFSGGQRQRIAIARALYRDPEILLLDEATSALDAISERKIQEALAWYKAKGKTVVVIAHGVAGIKHFDRIVVLKDGCVAEEGSHDDLIRWDGYYKKLWMEQFVIPAE
jgi:ATP-binding cassette, subfamily C, bacteriocin exporter